MLSLKKEKKKKQKIERKNIAPPFQPAFYSATATVPNSLSLSNYFLLSLSIAGAGVKYLRGRERERKKSREEPFLLCLKKLDWEMLFAFDDGHPFQGKQEKLKSIYW